VALAVAPVSTTSVPASAATTIFTAPTGYVRDVIIENGGTAGIYVGVGSSVASTAGMLIPASQQLLLQGPFPASTTLYAIAASSSTAPVYVGYGSVVSVI
jgi:hypothetical protein